MRTILIITGSLMLAGCGNSAPPPPSEPPAKLPAGQWEVTAKITAIDGKAAEAAKAKVGDVATSRACVGVDGAVPPSLFVAAGESCEAQSPYVRNGRVSMQMTCKREGSTGAVMADISGKYTADAITGEGKVTTYLSGMDNYVVKQELSGRRVGECAAGEAKA